MTPIGDIGHEGEFYFFSLRTLSELGGDGTNNIISNTKENGDNNTHFFDPYSTSTMMSRFTLSVDFFDCQSIPLEFSMYADWFELSNLPDNRVIDYS